MAAQSLQGRPGPKPFEQRQGSRPIFGITLGQCPGPLVGATHGRPTLSGFGSTSGDLQHIRLGRPLRKIDGPTDAPGPVAQFADVPGLPETQSQRQALVDLGQHARDVAGMPGGFGERRADQAFALPKPLALQDVERLTQRGHGIAGAPAGIQAAERQQRRTAPRRGGGAFQRAADRGIGERPSPQMNLKDGLPAFDEGMDRRQLVRRREGEPVRLQSVCAVELVEVDVDRAQVGVRVAGSRHQSLFERKRQAPIEQGHGPLRVAVQLAQSRDLGQTRQIVESAELLGHFDGALGHRDASFARPTAQMHPRLGVVGRDQGGAGAERLKGGQGPGIGSDSFRHPADQLEQDRQARQGLA